MSTAIDIEINISLKPPENLDAVVTKFTQLASAIQSIRGVQVPAEVTSSLRQMQEGAVDVTRAFRGITLEEFARQIPRIQGLEQVTQKQAEALARLYVQNQLAGGSIEDFKNKAAEMHEQLGLTRERAIEFANVLGTAVPFVRLTGVASRDLVEAFGGTNAALQATMTRFSQLPETIGLPTSAIAELSKAALDFQARGEPALERCWKTIDRVAEQTGRPIEEVQDAFNAINNTMSYSPQVADAFAAGLSQVQLQLGRTSPEVTRLKTYIQEFHAALGPVGFASMRVGYQFYWLSIGMMFYALSLRRQEAAMASLQSQMLQVVQAQERVREAQQEYNRAVIQFGPGSEQARRAALNYVMAQKQVELQEKQVMAAAMQLRATMLMTYFTIIPVAINAAAFIMNLAASIAAGAAIQTGVGVPAAYNYSLSIGGIAVAHVQAGVMAGFHAKMNALLANSWIPVIGFALAAATAIGMYILMNQQMAEAQEEARREMEELIASINAQVNALTGHSLYDSLVIVTSAVQRFRSEIQAVPRAAIDIPVRVQTPEIPRLEVQEVTLPVRVREPEIRPRVEVPEVEVPSYRTSLQIEARVPRIEAPRLRSVVEVETPKMPEIEVPRVRIPVETIREQIIPVRTVIQRPEIPIPREVQIRIGYVASRIPDFSRMLEQRIVQRIVSAPQVVPRDVVLNIRQNIVPARIPEIPTVVQQNIVQRVQEARVSPVPSLVQNIQQRLIPTRIPSISPFVQTIQQRLQAVRIPEVQSTIQTITQRLIPARIPEIRSVEQVIRQRIVSVPIPRIPDTLQRIRQEVIAPTIPRIEDVQYRVFPRVETARIPTITGTGRVQVVPILTQTRFVFPRHSVLVSPILTGQPVVRPRIQTVGLEALGLPITLRTPRGQVFYINVQFPNMVVRGPEDINQIALAIEKVLVRQSTLVGMRYA